MENTDYIRGGTQKSTYERDEVIQWLCPLCSSGEEVRIKTERKVLGVVRCKNCDLMRINPRLVHPEKIYQGKAEIYSEEFRLVRTGKFPHHRDTNYLADLKLISKYKPTGNFLDIGSHTGSFLRLARGKGWTLTGLEPSPQLGQLAREWWGLDIVQGFVETANLPSSHYDVVSLTDVFEHISNPAEVLQSIRRFVKPDGIIFIKVPNGKCNLLKYWVRKFVGRPSDDDFDSYEHVIHYEEKTLRRMLEENGFDALEFTIEPPVQIPVWHKYVGHYYQHKCPFWMDWKTYAARNVLYGLSFVERKLGFGIGYFAPNIGVIARPKAN